VLKGVTLEVGIESVTVTVCPGVTVFAACVDMAPSVSAAEVYSAFKVSAGCGELVENDPQARMVAKAIASKKPFLKLIGFINASMIFGMVLNVKGGWRVPKKEAEADFPPRLRLIRDKGWRRPLCRIRSVPAQRR